MSISETKFDGPRNENAVYAAWKHEGRAEVFEELGRLMLKHATAVTYLLFKQRREDVAQEAVVKGLQGLEDFRGDSLFSTWFHAVAMNHARDKLRAEIVSRNMLELQEDMVQVEPDWHAALQLDQLVEDLDDEDKALVRDKLEGRVESELTGKYGLTPEGIRSRWNVIKKKLRKRLE